jgi:hypothetical protein
MRPARGAARGPATGRVTALGKVSAPAMTEERRRMLGISRSPARAFAFGLAVWGAYGALVLSYLGIIG